MIVVTSNNGKIIIRLECMALTNTCIAIASNSLIDNTAATNCQQNCLEVPCVQEVLVISPDKPGWPKRHVTNTG